MITQLPETLSREGIRARQQLLLIGVDHKSAPLALREKVAYRDEEGDALLRRLTAREEIAEACLLSTCNRTELYLEPRDGARAYRSGLAEVFAAKAPEIEEEGRFYIKHGDEAARHLLEVAGGLQSMVLGEPEILGQVKQAATMAEAAGASGPVLRRLLGAAITAGKRVRAETDIGTGAVSFGYAVVELARSIFTRLESCTVLVIGTGETGQQVARNLLHRGAGKLLYSNRGAARAAAFQQLFPAAQPIPFSEFRDRLTDVDVVVTSIGAAEPVLRRAELATAIAGRARPLLVVDLGVPRNVESGVAGLDNLFLQDIDTIKGLIDQNLRRRREEIPNAQALLDRELAFFTAWYRSVGAEPLIAALQRRAEKIRRRELETALAHFPADTHDALERLTRGMVRKLLHHPSSRLRRADEEHGLRLDLVRELFRLDEEDLANKKREASNPDDNDDGPR